MGWNGSIMTTPIGMGDISSAVGYSSLDLGTLIANGTIKKWALHKPVKLLTGDDTPDNLYTSDAAWLTYMQDSVSEASSNTLCPYGLKVVPSINIYDVIGTNNAPTVDWVYQQPPATGTFWRRMLDFNGYVKDPNPPINAPDDFNYYKDSTNTFTLNTNEGEAGTASIQLSKLNTLDDYKLMLAIKTASTWCFVVMPTAITDSLEEGTPYINWTLPGSLTLNAGNYDAYIVGVASSANLIANQWNYNQADSSMQAFNNMLPLPFPNKTDCHFTFKVVATAPTNEIYLTYTFYLNFNNIIQSIVFDAWKYGHATPSSGTFALVLSNLIVYDDNDTQVQALSNSVVTMNSFTYDSTTNTSSCSTTLNVSSYNINAGTYPNLEGGDYDRIKNNSSHNGAYAYVVVDQGPQTPQYIS